MEQATKHRFRTSCVRGHEKPGKWRRRNCRSRWHSPGHCRRWRCHTIRRCRCPRWLWRRDRRHCCRWHMNRWSPCRMRLHIRNRYPPHHPRTDLAQASVVAVAVGQHRRRTDSTRARCHQAHVPDRPTLPSGPRGWRGQPRSVLGKHRSLTASLNCLRHPPHHHPPRRHPSLRDVQEPWRQPRRQALAIDRHQVRRLSR